MYTTNRSFNSYGADGDLVMDETGQAHHVHHKTQAVRAAQDAERVNLKQRDLLIEVQQLLQAGDRQAAILLLQAYHRKIYPRALYDKLLDANAK